MLGGFFGKILWVDLSENKVWEEKLDEEVCLDYLGGYGLGAKILFDRQKPGLGDFDPGNILGFVTGALVGTPAMSGCRLTVVGKSPLTKTWGDSSCGGFFAPALKSTGFDALFVVGKSNYPVYLWIDKGKAELISAGEIWGIDTVETEEALKKEHGNDINISSIGVAGERQNLIAAIMHDGGRAAGRSGLGALMGSKKLKALAVRGEEKVPMHDESSAKQIRRKYIEKYRQNPKVWEHWKKYGTIDHVASSAFSNDSPVKNWTGVGITDFPTAEKISDDAILEYEVKRYGCWGCPLACSGIYEIKEGPYKVSHSHKPEYETCGMLGNNLLNDNLESIIYINELCNRNGFDTISFGAAIAYAIECFENGLITTEDTKGLELKWGDHESIVKLAEQMVKGEGLGALLANGAMAAVKEIGKDSEDYAVHGGNQELPAHDPRYGPSWGTYYKADANPGKHTQIGLVPFEIGGGYPNLDLGAKVEKYDIKGKGLLAAKAHNYQHAFYSMGLCLQAILRTDVNAWVELTNAVCGTSFQIEDFEKIGARIAALRQSFNIREGVEVSNIPLSKRSWAEPLPGGPLEGVVLELDTMVNDYYCAQGWDEKGWPTPERLKELGLDNVGKEIY